MCKSKNCRKVAPADEEEATKKDEDWKDTCKDCEIRRLYLDCSFGCELVKTSLRKLAKKK
jgi:hypothetical protein